MTTAEDGKGGDLVGREHERAAVLAHVLGDADPGRLLLLGEAGIGKSALWRAGVAAAREANVRVLVAPPAEAERDLPFAVLGDLFADVLTEGVVALAAPRRRLLEIALQVRDPGVSALNPRGVALAVTELLRILAQRGPVLVAVDDVQWTDAASAAALAFALRRLGPAPVRVLAAARTPWLGRHEVGWPMDEAVVLDLPGLSLGATQHLISGRVRRLRHVELRWIHEEAAGNPLHALELARALRGADGAVPVLDPGTQVSDLVVRRLGNLDAPAAEVLLAASLGRRPTVDLLARACGRPILADLGALVAADLVHVTGDRVRFQHPLYATACAQAAGAAERRRVHRRLADAAAEPEDAVRHLALATSGPDAAVAGRLDEIALRARLRGAPQAAAELSWLAGRLTPVDDEDAKTTRILATSRYLVDAGATAAAEQRLRESLAVSTEPGTRHRLWMALGEVVYESRGVEEARAVTAAALEEAGDDPARRAQALVTRTSRTEMPVDERSVMIDEALALLSTLEHPDPDVRAQAAREQALCSFYLGDGLPRAPLYEAAALEADLRPPLAVAWRATTVLGECAKFVDDFAEAERLLAAASAEAEVEGDVGSIAEIDGHRAELELWLGRWDAAEALARAAVDDAEQSERRGRIAMAHCYAGMVAAHRGDPTAADALAEALAEAARADNDWVRAMTCGALGFLGLTEGRLDAAGDALAEADEFAHRELVCEPRQWRYLPDYVEVLIAAGEAQLADDRAEPLRRWAGRAGGWARAMALRADGQIAEATGDRDRALRLLADAAAAYEALPLPFELARARLALGSAQRRAGRRRDARATLEQAVAGFRDLGAPLWAARADDELARVAGRPAVADDELTPAEQQVARLVARGASNREVAAALSISPRTVEVHLGRIYRKLGIRSRAQLAAAYS
ncbi:AAA family ATPase [Nocardioides terrisoli]|uniref:AAA family ATPase n=1 Tax=Nocardioides terrisoli TaxID=3388267 RepID=UPI00287B8415|nr:AAA family ATPase [Nocardioides marmorisolisilvae]